MINFCQQPFISDVNASLIHQDGYDVHNLFSLDPMKRQKGFQIERFVRPPLSITISFKIPVTVHYIVIWVGLYEHNERCKVEIVPSSTKDSLSVQSKKCYSSFVLTQPNALSVFHNPLLTHLDKVTPNKVLGSQVCERLVSQQIISQPLKPINQLTTTTNLSLCIKQFMGPRALSIKCLEVWGMPSRYCTSDHVKCFEKAKDACLQLQDKQQTLHSTTLYNTEDCQSGCSSQSSDERTKCDSSSDHKKEILPIPERFLDQLTYETMILPYCLPSGYYIDQLSIEKCKEADLLCGRPPTDPFTGLPFTESSQPIFCARLKSEIDTFLSCMDEEDFCSSKKGGKTVGTAQDITNHRRQLKGNKRNRSECVEIPMISSQKPRLVDNPTDGVFDKESMNEPGKSPHRKQEHEITLQNSLEEALKYLYPT